jgi:hypothetical protein
MPLFTPPPSPDPVALFTAGRFADTVKATPPGKLRVRALLRLDRWDEALAEAEALARRTPDDSDANGLLALALLRAGRPEEAQAAAKRAGEGGFWALLAKATLLSVWDDKDEEAAPLVKKALALRRDEPEGWWLAAQTSQSEAEARTALARLAALRPKGHPFAEFADDLDALARTIGALRDSRRELERRRSQLRFPDTARLPFTQELGMIFVTVTINDVPLKLLFDTGAGGALVVSRSRTRRLGARFLTRTVIRGVQGKEESRMLRPRQVALGPLRFGPLPFREAGEMPVGEGIFGGALLDDYAVTIDFRASELRLKKVKPGAPAPSGGAAVLPFRQLFGGNLYVPLRLSAVPQDGKGFFLDAPLWSIVDTGAQTGLLSRRVAGALALGLPDEAKRTVQNDLAVGIGSTRASMTMDLVQRPFMLLGAGGLAHPVRFGIGASPLDEVISPGTSFETGALLGMPFLSRHKKVTFDYPNKRLVLEGAPPANPVTVSSNPALDPSRVPGPLPEGKRWVFSSDAGWAQVTAGTPFRGVPTTLPIRIAPGYRAYKIDRQSWVLWPTDDVVAH